ncbi:putative efflux ABC transporter, ATP-binding protein [Streptomyces sp. Tu6071]|uniref:ABC transporter ATP-binding protein n=1 Tax=unclassified Streptomyces TaxID=2593676 RepID=UPI00020E5837|nr:ABC transporter ATP-binding protein [Streptomyces sp. Tu6071]EGJ75389.1 putative efflux ABC transporter, ATP-binding protein [Streptomyces sp. Tu6071]MYX23381.1 ATP-binding cassette domain-containing protein [Streptomyces sp. SID8380]
MSARPAEAGKAAVTTTAAPAPGVPRAPLAPLVIETEGLTKRYPGDRLAVDGLDLRVPEGSVFGFLGPNGSGKTTTIRMLLGLVTPSAGRARVLGGEMPGAGRRVLPHVGALIEGPALYGFLSGRDNLRRLDAADPTASRADRERRVSEALDRVGLAPAAHRRARTYSLGMKQRLGLAAALLRPRRLLVLDEPTNGLDPQGMREIRALVRALAAEGTTVFLSSHLLDEIEQVCDHVAVMAAGRLRAQGPVTELLAARAARVVVTTGDTEEATRVLATHGVADVRQDGPDRLSGEPPAGLDPAALNAALVGAGVRVRAFGTEAITLEERFVELTGEGFDGGR